MNVQLNIFEGRQQRDKGIQQAVDSANRKDAGWSEQAFEMFKEWLSGWPSGFKFQMEGFRQVAQIKGLPDPPTARVFGSLAVRARKENLIKSNGPKATSSETAHGCYANEWEKI